MVDGDAVPGMGRGLVAHLWPDRSLSMAFASKGARDSKLERGLVVTFALALLSHWVIQRRYMKTMMT